MGYGSVVRSGCGGGGGSSDVPPPPPPPPFRTSKRKVRCVGRRVPGTRWNQVLPSTEHKGAENCCHCWCNSKEGRAGGGGIVEEKEGENC